MACGKFARRRAAEGSLAPYTIPLLANTQTRSSKNRVTWTLKFTLPAPAAEGATRRFSAVPREYGPSGAHALEGAVRYAYPFDYQHEATTLLPNSDFLSLPDHVTQYGQLDAAATECRKMKRPKPTLARLAHPNASSTISSAPLAPAPLGTGTSIVQARMPEFKVANFRVVKKGRCVIGIMGGDNKQDELREMLEKT